jgi:hypothetical protein
MIEGGSVNVNTVGVSRSEIFLEKRGVENSGGGTGHRPISTARGNM